MDSKLIKFNKALLCALAYSIREAVPNKIFRGTDYISSDNLRELNVVNFGSKYTKFSGDSFHYFRLLDYIQTNVKEFNIDLNAIPILVKRTPRGSLRYYTDISSNMGSVDMGSVVVTASTTVNTTRG